MKKAGFTKAGNIKLGEMWTFSKLYGDMCHYIEDLHTFVNGTCGKHCEGCRGNCYVRKSYRYPSVMKSHAINTIAMRENETALFSKMNDQIKRAKYKPETIRINQSGEIETRSEFSKWCELAGAWSKIQFYIYTKAFDLITPEILDRYESGTLPENLTINISVWHNYGIAEYEKLRHVPNCKAFVYDDGFDYSGAGLKQTTRCYAYRNGKLDHSITCERCGKCFSRRATDKVIFCNEH